MEQIMARNRYQIYANGLACLQHRSNDLQGLIERAKRLHSVFGDNYEVRSIHGVEWSSEEVLGDGN